MERPWSSAPPPLPLTRLVPAILGVALLAGVAHFAGIGVMREQLGAALPWVPLLFLLEGARIPLEALATRRLLGARAEQVPWPLLLRAQLIFYAVSTCLPGGRVVGEGTKAGLLGPRVGVPQAAAVAAASQAASLVADALVALLGFFALYLFCGITRLTALVLLFVIGCCLLAVAVATATRIRETPSVLQRFPRAWEFIDSFRRAAREQPFFAPDVVALLVSARLSQVLLLGTALGAVGAPHSPLRTLGLVALVMAGAVVGEAIPAQLGATDAVLVAAAPTLGLSLAQAATVGVLFHLVQLAWAVTGAALGALLRPRARPSAEPART